jgi:Trypsin-like peptidase domain
MRDLRSILTEDVRQEFLDRFSELTAETEVEGGGLESLDSIGLSVDDVAKAFDEINESPSGTTDLPPGLEAIILRFGRPAFFVQDDSFSVAETPSSSEAVNDQVNKAKSHIDAAIPRVGRINLRDHRMSWVGTGWLVAPDVIVTNRHVAREFAESDGAGGFAFTVNHAGRTTKAELDLYREHERAKELVFRLSKILWIEPSQQGHHDVAFLKASEAGGEGEKQPTPIALMTDAEFAEVQPNRWLAVIGYPGFSIYNNADDQQRIFQGVFEVKRLQPGMTRTSGGGQLLHDASTLGGNSGSLVLDLETGKAMAIHFGGIEGDNNFAVTAPVVRQLIREKLDTELS